MSDLMDFKCPSCGGAIIFDSSGQKMKCTYCGTEYDESLLRQYEDALKNMPSEDDFSWRVESNSNWSEEEQAYLQIFTCKSCGGEIVGEPTTISTSCPYCDNPVVMTKQIVGDLKPHYIIPFQLNKQQAMQGLQRHMEGKKLLAVCGPI